MEIQANVKNIYWKNLHASVGPEDLIISMRFSSSQLLTLLFKKNSTNTKQTNRNTLSQCLFLDVFQNRLLTVVADILG